MDTQEPTPQASDVTSPVWPPPPSSLSQPALTPMSKRVLTSVELFREVVARMTWMGMRRGACLGALVGVFFWIVGAVIGVAVGGAIGLVLGVLDGFILAAMASRFSRPMGNSRRFRFTLCLTSGFVTLIAASAITWLVIRQGFQTQDDSWVIVLFPTLVAALAADAGHRVAKWYESES